MRSATILMSALILAGLISLSETTYADQGWQKLPQGELTVKWWQWLYTIPVSQNPAYDPTGGNAFVAQPYSDLLFLVGTLAPPIGLPTGDILGKATRAITVKKGTAFFFPIINTEWDSVCRRPNLGGDCFGLPKYPNNLSIPQLQALAAASTDAATDLYVSLTSSTTRIDTPPTMSRLKSFPQAFPYKLPATDNIYQSQGINFSGTVAPAVGDGYYSLIPGNLPPGQYQLKFGGKGPLDNAGHYFILDITYNITILSN
jgi:hypothetical protein